MAKKFGRTGADNAASVEATLDGWYIVAGTSYSNDWDIPNSRGALDS